MFLIVKKNAFILQIYDNTFTLGGFEFIVGKSTIWQESIQPFEGGSTGVRTWGKCKQIFGIDW